MCVFECVRDSGPNLGEPVSTYLRSSPLSELHQVEWLLSPICTNTLTVRAVVIQSHRKSLSWLLLDERRDTPWTITHRRDNILRQTTSHTFVQT